MSLRTSLVSEIYYALDSSSFTAADFEITTDDKLLLSVIFRSDRTYKFTVQEEMELLTRVHRARRIPGEELNADIAKVTSLSELPSMVLEWTKYLRSELRAKLPVYDELDALRQRVEDHIREHVASPDDRFSQEEAQDLRDKLNEMLAKFEEMKEQSELTDSQLRELQKQVATLSDDLRGFPKGTWYRTAFTKLFTFGKSVAASPEGRKLMFEATQKVLGVDSPGGP
jgi:hypothetical protein